MPARGFGQVFGGLALGVLAALLLLEIVFRVLPTSTATNVGYYYDEMLLTYPAHHRFTSATGWQLQNARRNEANNFGYLADHDFGRDPRAVALIGDSFVEGSMLEPSQRFAPHLEARLEARGGSRPVYAMGAPGTALLDYAERMRFAAQKFGIHDFVLLLEHGDIAQAVCGSGNVQAQCLAPRTLEPRVEKQGQPRALKRFLRHSALAQYLFSQLKLDPERWLYTKLGIWPAVVPREGQLPRQVIDRVIDEFFVRTAPYRTGKLVLVLSNGPAKGKPDEVEARLAAAAEQHGAVLIRGEPLLEAETRRTGLSMHVSPHDGHLNGLAFGALARAVAPALDAGRM